MPGVAGLGQFANLRGGGLGKKEECGVFEGGGGGGGGGGVGGGGGGGGGGIVDTPMHTINLAITLTVILIY